MNKKNVIYNISVTPLSTFFSVLHLQNLRGECASREEKTLKNYIARVKEKKNELQNVQHKLPKEQDEEVNVMKTQQLQKQQKKYLQLKKKQRQ